MGGWSTVTADQTVHECADPGMCACVCVCVCVCVFLPALLFICPASWCPYEETAHSGEVTWRGKGGGLSIQVS